MKNGIACWFYLEPYTFIFDGEDEKVIYNTFSGTCLSYTDPIVLDLLTTLSQPQMGYCIPLSGIDLKRKEVLKFVREVRSHFSGNVLPLRKGEEGKKPFLFMPLLRLYNNVERIKKERGQSLGELILRNLSEVTLFLPGECKKDCSMCDKYYKQFIHCTSGKEDGLTINDYICLFESLEACGVNQVNLVVNGGTSRSFLEAISQHLTTHFFKKSYYLDVSFMDQFLPVIASGEQTSFHVSIHPPVDKSAWLAMHEKYKQYNIFWRYMVTTMEDVDDFFPDEVNNLSMVPFYNGTNDRFFEENVYVTREELLEHPICKQQIFRRQALNEHFFGKLYILPSGEAFPNPNFSSLGNIREQTLGEIVYREFDNSQAWLKTRDSCVCKGCVNRYLCPSVSNYELAIGKMNLCHIHPDIGESI